ncbi:MAG TPA: DUF4012 domain-containing protein [Candidatus Nanoarchaeia archaeon]|nr:DUF4012 domain-containing protein [Candidatus Nanoarchaeia archaeon]
MFGKKKNKTIDFLTGHENVNTLAAALRLHQKSQRRRPVFSFFKYLAIFLLVIFVLAIALGGIIFFQAKGIYDLAVSGKNGLQSSLASAQAKNFSAMGDNSLAAENSFSALAGKLAALRANPIFKNLNLGQTELTDLDYLVASAGVISKALNEAAVIGGQWNEIMGGKFGANFSQFSTAQKQALLKSIYESGPEFNGLKADLDLALLNLDKVQADGFLAPFQGQIADAKDKLSAASSLLSEATVVSQLAPEFFGYPVKSTFLVLFENDAELRPAGGFLGTYGILQTENGDVIRFDSHDIYHLDEPMEALHLLSIMPPDPIKIYLNKNWYMRDSNWSPDWPTSAQQIVWFYNKENNLLPPKNQINNFNGQFTGVIAVTPEFVTSLLELTGPVTVNGEQFTADNFTNLLQYKVEQDLAAQNVTSWQRKEIIGKILAEMKTKLFNLDYGQWPAALAKIAAAVSQKNALVYLPNEYQEGLARSLGAGGEIKQVSGDYLLLVDANLGALKTDSVMRRSIDYQLRQNSGALLANLKITYVNTGKADWRTTDYRSYTRIYLPPGSQIISATGFSKLDKTYNESGKLVVPGLLQVPLGKSRTLNISYRLPPDLAQQFSQGNYSLYLQKQPGNMVQTVKVDVTASSAIKSYNPLTGVNVSGNNIVWSSDLTTDKEFSLNF